MHVIHLLGITRHQLFLHCMGASSFRRQPGSIAATYYEDWEGEQDKIDLHLALNSLAHLGT